MPETEVAQPAPATESVKEEKKELAEAEATKSEEKKDESEKKEKAEPEKKAEKKKPAKEAAPPPPSVHKKDFEKDVVYLYQFNRTPVIPSMSPPCLKVETWIKLNGIKYENVDHHGRLRSKRGLLPFIELNGEEICDSEQIIKTLGNKFDKDLNAGMTTEQRNIQHAMITMIQNHLQWACTHFFTKNSDNMLKGLKLNLQAMMGSKLPNPILNFMFKHTFLKKGLKRVKSTSFAGCTADEIEEAGKNDLKVLSEMLGDKQFFFGDEPHTLDLVAFVQISILLAVDPETPCPMRDFINNDCQNLVGFYTRMKDLAWGEHWDQSIGESLDMNPHIPKPEPPKPEEPKEEEKKDNKEEEKKEEEKEKGDKDEKEKEEKKEEEEKK